MITEVTIMPDQTFAVLRSDVVYRVVDTVTPAPVVTEKHYTLEYCDLRIAAANVVLSELDGTYPDEFSAMENERDFFQSIKDQIESNLDALGWP